MPWKKANDTLASLIDSDTNITHQELFEEVLRTVGIRPTDKVWYFAYGSQIWAPCFEHVQHRIATVHHFTRDYCIYSHLYRGTENTPGLVLGLREQPQDTVKGVAFHVHAQELTPILEQEMLSHVYSPFWLNATFNDATTDIAFTFVARPHSPFFASLPLTKQAQIIATAKGNRGTCLEYFERTQIALHKAGIPDERLSELEQRINNLLSRSE